MIMYSPEFREMILNLIEALRAKLASLLCAFCPSQHPGRESTHAMTFVACQCVENRMEKCTGPGLENTLRGPLYFQYFRLFKPSLFRPNCSEAIQQLHHCPCARPAHVAGVGAQGPTASAPKQWKSDVHVKS